jgi:signal recognition particle subunit SRP54
MGDVLTLIERVEQEYDQDVAQRAQEALLEGQFTLDDFLEQMQQIRKMGPLNSIIGMLPGVPKELKNADIGEKELGRVEAIIRSMTTQERRTPKIVDGSRRARIAKGSGTSVSEVNLLLQQFDQMAKMMKRFGGMAGGGKKGKGKGKKGKGPGRVTAAKAALPNLRQLQELQKAGGPPDLDELLGTTRRDKQWP